MYVKENTPVFLLFLAFNFVILLIGYIDNSIPNVAVVHYVLLNR